MTISVIRAPWGSPPAARRVVRELVQFEMASPLVGAAGGDPIPVRGLLRWTSTAAHTVGLVLRPGTAAEITWLIPRDVLDVAVRAPAGYVDVSIVPDLRAAGSHRVLVLSTPGGRRRLRFPVTALVAFLERIGEAEGGAR